MTGSMRAATFTVLAFLAVGASAQSSSVQQPDKLFSLPFGDVPAEIFGIPCTARPGDANFAATLRCDPANIVEKPSISVSVADWKIEPSRAEMIADMRGTFHDSSMLKVIREDAFAPPNDLKAVGFRGAYETNMGVRYVWAVRSKGQMIRVIAFVFSPISLDGMAADIEWKIFGVPLPS